MHRILAIGAAMVLALAVSGEAVAWSWPADGAVVRPFAFGADAYAAGQHRGIDVAGPDGSAVKAPAAGVVTFAGSLPTYGRGVTILTADGYAVTLVHLGAIDVAKDATVGEGDTVGTMGVERHARAGWAERPSRDPTGVRRGGIRRSTRAAPAERGTGARSVPDPGGGTGAGFRAGTRRGSPALAAGTLADDGACPGATDAERRRNSGCGVGPGRVGGILGDISGVVAGEAAQAAVPPVQQASPQAGVTIADSGAATVAPAAEDTAGPPGLEVPATSSAPFHVGATAHRSGAASTTHPASAATPTLAGTLTHQAVGRRMHVVRPSPTGPEIVAPVGREARHVSEAPGPARTTPARSVPPERADRGSSVTHAVVRDRPVTLVTDATPSAPRPRQTQRGAPRTIRGRRRRRHPRVGREHRAPRPSRSGGGTTRRP